MTSPNEPVSVIVFDGDWKPVHHGQLRDVEAWLRDHPRTGSVGRAIRAGDVQIIPKEP